MQVKVGDRYARCPYCGGTDFVEDTSSAEAPLELVCARCGGFASRKILLDRAADPEEGRMNR